MTVRSDSDDCVVRFRPAHQRGGEVVDHGVVDLEIRISPGQPTRDCRHRPSVARIAERGAVSTTVES